MKRLALNLFIENWERKCLSILLALVIWLTVNHSLTMTKTVSIPVKINNLPTDKTIQGLTREGFLPKKIALTLTGNRSFLADLSANDLEAVIDASGMNDEWIATISKKNLISLSPDLEIANNISDITHERFIIRLTRLVTEKIPVLITQPIGEAPRGYQYLDVWPYRLTLSVSGPEEVVKQLKSQGEKLTFNLNHITKDELDAIAAHTLSSKDSEISFFVPDLWKQISLPSLSDLPLEIDDPQAKLLRIDFVRSDLIPLDRPLPIALYFPPESLSRYNPANTLVALTPLVQEINGLKMIQKPLFAKGVSHLFVQLVRNMVQISVPVAPKKRGNALDWCVTFVNSQVLEDLYVTALLSDSSTEELHKMVPPLREEYLRNRFRNYMNRFQLYLNDEKKFELKISLEDGSLFISEKT
ncbi:MAG: hypothetical protein A2Y28_00965 [Chlamydiae bacterium GWC2_50_10]|nr:MAG: hypothetical protein A2Z85_01080 [Chlamydiae bacterium GWA2_50_15]OGN53793.1 MAG: hypothetical protein A2Y28_00965 [Chlamydiae bacterium GWC2_50_10]OGN55074.1 MAG: hypothetical protein A2098_00795 [Chlamydiae bacterium GWF2_49_8]OGN57778.1 MAG: hypothetical protein A3D18_04955 [Chlamydiae bacterium RIFCSPHIGHO2_02_FULL_49_29]OGN63455.1 MAG: hypothetical protein A3E26_01420 [Chlamydiae bacterium RIFCSPHIGHO2_12_FULL_49_32]OGN68251.1 MAG: hypothetical protein A3I15_05240 [Chlamydiae bact